MAVKTLRSLRTAFGYPGMLRKIGARNMNETARRWRVGRGVNRQGIFE